MGVGLAAAHQKKTKSQHNEKHIHFVEKENLQEELDNLGIEPTATEACNVCGDELQPHEIEEVVATEDGYRAICDEDSCLTEYRATMK